MDLLEAVIAHVWLVVKGAGIGFAVAAPVGPIGMLCIRTTLERGRVAGFASGLGAALADAIFGAIGVLGITALSDVINAERFWLELFGGLFVVGFGGQRPAEAAAGQAHPAPGRGRGRPGGAGAGVPGLPAG